MQVRGDAVSLGDSERKIAVRGFPVGFRKNECFRPSSQDIDASCEDAVKPDLVCLYLPFLFAVDKGGFQQRTVVTNGL